MKKVIFLFISLLHSLSTYSPNTRDVLLDEVVITSTRLYPIPLEIINHIKSHESFSPTRYSLAINNTKESRIYIGYGHSIRKGERFPNTISEKMATELLVKNYLEVFNIVKQEVVGRNRQHGVAMLAYNVGYWKLKKWRLWDSIQSNGDCSKWLEYCYFNGEPHDGLLERRTFEYNYFKK